MHQTHNLEWLKICANLGDLNLIQNDRSAYCDGVFKYTTYTKGFDLKWRHYDTLILLSNLNFHACFHHICKRLTSATPNGILVKISVFSSSSCASFTSSTVPFAFFTLLLGALLRLFLSVAPLWFLRLHCCFSGSFEGVKQKGEVRLELGEVIERLSSCSAADKSAGRFQTRH